MSDVIVISPDRPAYRILSEQGWFGPNDHLYKMGDMVYYDGVPNEDMEALNEPAHAAQREFFARCDAGAQESARVLGRAYRGRVRLQDRLRQATMESRQVQLVRGGEGVPIMNGTNESRLATVEDIGEKVTPMQGQPSHEPKRRGRPPKNQTENASA